jgi:hypothetical protein
VLPREGPPRQPHLRFVTTTTCFTGAAVALASVKEASFASSRISRTCTPRRLELKSTFTEQDFDVNSETSRLDVS